MMVWAVLSLSVHAPAFGQAGARGPGAAPEAGGALPTVAAKTAGLTRKPGLLTFWLDPGRGKVWLELPAGTETVVGEYLYLEGIATGLGSNPVGLDRGQMGPGRLVELRRVGGKLLIEEQNLLFRALSESERERASVAESFATSVLWGGEIAALDGDGRALVDFTSFLLRDAHGVASTLRRSGQGSYSLDGGRSAVDLDACLAFPDNVELEALLTFSAGGEPGELVASVLPSPELVTLVQHHSFIRLPPEGYRPRAYDPRAGSFPIRFQDYAAPLDRPIVTQWIVRHRLEKIDPAAPRSRVRKPIVYYVDRGAPEAVKKALIEGASWWAQAFDAAGFIDGFRVEELPPGAHPLDARYNVVQWVHRSTRGWSYGGGIIDPRTGEMLKGHVTLGSLRVRQDRLLFEGLLGTAKSGSGAPDDPVELALWRIRQLAAHEVGHALGFSHNFAASTYADRASVMDYPAPKVKITPAGGLDLSDAYGTGAGAWDVQAVRYAYSQFPPGADESAELERIVADGLAKGYLFFSDADARPQGSAHPLAHLWDNGPDAAAELLHELEVRRLALQRFDASRLAAGRPLALLQEVFVPLYLHHRYQLEAAAKLVGGVDYRHAVVGDGQPPIAPVAAAWQRRALAAVLASISPEELDIRDQTLALLGPRPPDEDSNPEIFSGATPPTFDLLGAAATAADLAVEPLLHPARAARLVEQSRRDPGQPSLDEVLDALLAKAFAAPPSSPRLAEIAHTVQAVVVSRMIELAASPRAAPAVRARVEAKLRTLQSRFESQGTQPDTLEGAHRALLAGEITRFRNRQATAPAALPPPPQAPPGMPIGGSLSMLDEGCSWAAGGDGY